MFHDVVLSPGGRRFEIRQGETILEAGLRAGASLRYSCTNGTCGECRARLLGGEVARVQHHDFCFSAAETAQGCLLMCCHTACSDLQLAAAELGGVEEIAEQRVAAKVTRVEQPSEGYAIAHLRTPRSQTLQFLAGQEVELQVEGQAWRLPLANCPCDSQHPQLHVRRAADAALFSALRKGAGCELRGPLGEFVLRERPDRALLFIAYETGFAPVYSLLEHAIALEWRAPLRVIWLADGAGGHYMRNYCRALQDALDDFTFALEEIGEPQRFVARLHALLAQEPALGDCDVYAVPPPRAVATTREALLARGLTGNQFRIAELALI